MATTFHEHALWQSAYVALMDAHDIFDPQKGGENDEMARQVIDSATGLAAKIADGLSRLDKRFGRQILMDAIGMVAVVRTHLAVCWGRGLVDDETFRNLDNKYAELAVNLQNSR
jgi:four helix bundle protein